MGLTGKKFRFCVFFERDRKRIDAITKSAKPVVNLFVRSITSFDATMEEFQQLAIADGAGLLKPQDK